MNKANLQGRRFERLEVLEPFPGGRNRWLAVCVCGGLAVAESGNLLRGNTRSCGCLKQDSLKARATHGLSTVGSPTYQSWVGMRQRCWNPANAGFLDYGGRGIEVDPRWWYFEEFLYDMGDRPAGLSLERKDNSLGYSKSNCVWAGRVEQANNKRTSARLSLAGETKTLAHWARDPRCQVPASRLYRRCQDGWPLLEALTVRKLKSKYERNF